MWIDTTNKIPSIWHILSDNLRETGDFSKGRKSEKEIILKKIFKLKKTQVATSVESKSWKLELKFHKVSQSSPKCSIFP